MKTTSRFTALVFVCIFFLFTRIISAQTLWEGDVYSGPVAHSSASPAPTINVTAGDVLTVSAGLEDLWRLFTDEKIPAMFHWSNADGLPGWEVEGLLIGSLVGRIGERGDWFFVGTNFTGEMPETGMLYLACWDDPEMYPDNEEFIHVTIGSEKEFNPADLDQDNDVDGVDVEAYSVDMAGLLLSDFADDFGYMLITDNADLDNLSVSSGLLNPSFSSYRTDYIVSVDNSVDTFFVTPTLSDPLASIKINDFDVDSGMPHEVTLDRGSNYIRIEVTSREGSSVKVYSMIVVRPGNALLSSLSVVSYSLNPLFSSGTQVYNIDVDQGVTGIDLIPETDDPGSQIWVNDVQVPSGNPVSIVLSEGINEITIDVLAQDGSTKSYYVYVKKRVSTAQTVFVVDQADASDEFETLGGAINYLNNSLFPGQVGQISIQTTSPMQVDELTITGDMIIIVEPGASNVISGPFGMPLVINAFGGWDISGLNFMNSPGYTINAARGLSMVGTSFSADTIINISGTSGLTAKGSANFSKGMELVRDIFSGYLNINLTGDADADFRTVGTNAAGIVFNASGAFTGDAGLIFKSNPISNLNITAAFKGNSKAQIIGHGSLSLSRFGLDMEENAAFYLEQHTSAALEAKFHGLKGKLEFKNVITANADLKVDLQNSEYTGNGNSLIDFNLDMSYTHDLVYFGFTEKGGYAYKTFTFNGEDAPSNGEIVIGFDDFDIQGNINLLVGGKAKVTLENGTTLQLDAYLKFPGNVAELSLHDIQGKASFLVTIPESDLQFYLSAERSTLDKGMIINTESDRIQGTVDTVTTVSAGIKIGHDLGSMPGPKSNLSVPSYGESPLEESQLVFKNLIIRDENGQPGLYIEGVSVPVIIQDSTIDGNLWSIVCADIDADVTIENNTDLKGGIMLDGDPDETGVMISGQYIVRNNTITQNNSGGSCLSSHAIRDIVVDNNTMTASVAGAHGILLSGGKMQVNGGSINTMGPYISTAIGIGPSAGNANGILYANNVSPISGGIVPSEQGYVKLSNNTFSNAIVFDYKIGDVGRFLNDPVANNSGLDPDEHVVGSLIDWNDDEHNCPDYPTKCDEWNEDLQECGCREDGIDPPSEPGI